MKNTNKGKGVVDIGGKNGALLYDMTNIGVNTASSIKAFIKLKGGDTITGLELNTLILEIINNTNGTLNTLESDKE